MWDASYPPAIETLARSLPADPPPLPTGRAEGLETIAEHLWALVPAVLVLYLGFDAGGFFAGTTGAAAAGLAVLVAVRMLSAPRRVRAMSRAGIISLAAIVTYAAWTILSATWSHAPARSLLAFDLALLYLGVIALHSGTRMTRAQLRTMVRGLLCSLAIVCGAGLLTRTLPHVFPVGVGFLAGRLSYPVTYWNSLAMVAALGIVLAAHISSDTEEHPVARVLSAGLIPGFALTLLLTFSRGGILTLAVALILYVVLSPRLALLGTALAAAPSSAVAVSVGYNAGALASPDPTSATAIAQGHHVAAVAAVCIAVAPMLRALLLVAEGELPRTSSRRLAIAVPAASLVALVAVAAGLTASGWLRRQYHAFVDGPAIPTSGLARGRLESTSNNGRLEMWRVAVSGFDAHPWDGAGAGTYVLLWDRQRPSMMPVQDAHSLYLQTLAELGVVGLAAVAVLWLGLLAGAVRRLRAPPERALAALGIAIVVAWALHSALDWDWQMPVVVAPVLALAAAIGTRGPGPPRGRRILWPALAAGCALLVGVIPGAVAVSQAKLDASVRDFQRHDCPAAIRSARAAHTLVSVRPEPLEVIGYCQIRLGALSQARQTMRAAVSRDPGDWEFHYALAVATAAAGADPMPALRAAQRLDPLEPLVEQAIQAFAGERAAARRRTAHRLRLDIA